MEFLMGNPFSTPVGQRIENATGSSLPAEDWALNMEICDMINSSEEGWLNPRGGTNGCLSNSLCTQ
uniref:VHS domain-containing protein n=1 Tax=Sander lucioperca TaxID=283035 RepID=A0A8C9XPU1_SANLU